MNTVRNGNMLNDRIEKIVGNAVATESFEHLTVTDLEIEKLEDLVRGNITMDAYLKSGCDDERNEP